MEAYASASSIAQEVLRNIRTVTSFHGQKKEEERYAVIESYLLLLTNSRRYAKNLIEAKDIGIKKSIYAGICQGFSIIFIFVAFTITFW